MKTMTPKYALFVGAFIAVGLLMGAAGALADTIPAGGPPTEFPGLAVMMNSHGHGPPAHVNPPGLEIAKDKFQYKGKGRVGAFDVDWTVEADPDPYINVFLELVNTTGTAQDFTFSPVLNIDPQIIGGIITGGSLSGTLIDMNGDGASLSLVSGANPPPIYTAQIDGIDYETMNLPTLPLVAAPHGTAGIGPMEFGTPIPSMVEPTMSVLDTIGIEINASVSGRDRAYVVATFVVEPVPEPSSSVLLIMSVFAAIALCVRRRR